MRRRKKKSLSTMVKTVPLSVALATLASGALTVSAADEPYTQVRVKVGTGNYINYDLSQLSNNPEYAATVEQALKAAFADEQNSIVVGDGTKEVEFGKNAGKATLEQMWANPSNYEPEEPGVY